MWNRKESVMKSMIVSVLLVVGGVFSSFVSTSLAQPDYCEGDFDYDGDQDGTDAAVFKSDFGRSSFIDPCPPNSPTCNPPAPVPQTGLVTSYATGDDGDLEKGVEWPNPRFTDNEDGTVRDNLTGLIWLKDANCFEERTWDQALADCSTLEEGNCGLTDGSNSGDWRLPNLFELESLRNINYYGPCLTDTAGTGHWTEGDPFTGIPYRLIYYWSSTTIASTALRAWAMTMFSGNISYFDKTSSRYVWPVRGGHSTTNLTNPTGPLVSILEPQPTSLCLSEPCYDPPGSIDPDNISLSGIASDDGAVVNVTWSNSSGGTGTAFGTTNWTAEVPIVCGPDNIITVTAEDDEGNTDADSLIVNVEPCIPEL